MWTDSGSFASFDLGLYIHLRASLCCVRLRIAISPDYPSGSIQHPVPALSFVLVLIFMPPQIRNVVDCNYDRSGLPVRVNTGSVASSHSRLCSHLRASLLVFASNRDRSGLP